MTTTMSGPPPLQRGASLAGRLVERGGFPYPQHCELSSHLALEGKRRSGGEKFGMRTSKKSAQFTLLPSGRGILKHDSGKIKGPTATSPPATQRSSQKRIRLQHATHHQSERASTLEQPSALPASLFPSSLMNDRQKKLCTTTTVIV